MGWRALARFGAVWACLAVLDVVVWRGVAFCGAVWRASGCWRIRPLTPALSRRRCGRAAKGAVVGAAGRGSELCARMKGLRPYGLCCALETRGAQHGGAAVGFAGVFVRRNFY